MRVLVTGSSGFIGSHLIAHLDRDTSITSNGVDIKEGIDLRNRDNVNRLADFDLIYHFAATNGTKLFYEIPQKVLISNTTPTIYLTERYADTEARFVFASTCEIFNGAIDLGIGTVPTDETVPVLFQDISNPRWSYSIPKALGENLISNSFKNYAIIRYFNIYGPGQIDHFISEFYQRATQGIFELYGDDTRSFCYVKDAAVMSHQIGCSSEQGVFNVGREEERKVSEVARIILEIMRIPQSELKIFPSPKGSVTRRCPSMEKFNRKFGKPTYTKLEDGLEETIKWMQK